MKLRNTNKTISRTTLYLPSQNPPQSPFSKVGGLKFPSLKKRGQGRFSDKYPEAGFTLIEVIITLIVVAVAAGMMTAYFGTAITRSADPISRLINSTNQTSAQQIMEKITLHYSLISHWHPGNVYAVNDIVIPTTPNANGFQYICTAGGTSNATVPAVEPSWPIASNGTFTESTGVSWRQNGAAPALTDLQTSINTNQTTTLFGGNYTANQNEFIKFDPNNSNTELAITSTDPAYGRFLKVRITDPNGGTRAALFVLR